MTWNESKQHAWLASQKPPKCLVGSPGHDAAVLRRSAHRQAVCVDQTIEGVHFGSEIAPRRIARKAVGRTLSDLAATASIPTQILLTIAAPPTKTDRWITAIIEAAAQRAADFGAELVAGDLACSAGPTSITVTGIGELRGKRRPPGRDRARAGQLLLLTGPTGGSIRGRHLEIEPRIQAGLLLHKAGATAMMDISDGLALDLSRIANASNVAVELNTLLVHRDALWLSRKDGISARQHALTDGEDHELIATIGVADWKRAQHSLVKRLPSLAVVGRVVAGKGLRVADAQGVLENWTGRGGWLHG